MARLKARRIRHILNVFLLGLSLIAVRVWYLSVVQYDDHFQSSRKPQRRTLIQPALRGTIRDRFNLPLAMNTIQYNAAVCYSDIRQIPHVRWEKDEYGGRKRVLARKLYIEKLSQFLAEELEMDSMEIEDTIHGRASLFPHTPFVIKEDLSEKLYYKLKMAEKEWLGIQMQQAGKRVYPMGKCASDVIGHMGAISQREYHSVAQEMRQLRDYLTSREGGKAVFLPKGYDSPSEVRRRLRHLEERAYSINDQVGKCGVEAAFDEVLRGRCGRQTVEVDTRGNPLSQLPGGREEVSGQRLVLSLSAELQQTAEELLASYESFQDKRDANREKERSTPWVRGGSIVVMDPKSGEVLAMASTPRFDPNDFVFAHTPEKRKEKIAPLSHWLENNRYLGAVWEGRTPLEREVFDPHTNAYVTETKFLCWEDFLSLILPKTSGVRAALNKVKNFAMAHEIVRSAEDLLSISGHDSLRASIQLLYSSGSHIPIRGGLATEDRNWIEEAFLSSGGKALAIKEALDPFLAPINHNEDKLLFLDILRLFVPDTAFSEEALEAAGGWTLGDLHELIQHVAEKRSSLYEEAKEHFHQVEFRKWREEHFLQFLREKRSLERKNKRYARPYIEYLQAEEEAQFSEYWKEEEIPALVATFTEEEWLIDLSTQAQQELIALLRPFSKLSRPLWGKYPYLRHEGGVSYEKHLASAFYPYGGLGYGRSKAYRMATPMGSIFKVIPAYAALKERLHHLKGEIKRLDDLNPLTLIDEMRYGARIMGSFESGEPIKRFYKGGVLPRTTGPKGRIDIRGALERTSNIYFSILASDFLPYPNYLKEVSAEFGLGAKTGIDLPGEYPGNLPSDLEENKTGLYAFAIGQHSLVCTPLQTAVLLSTVANGGQVLKPQIVKLAAGKQPEKPNLENSEDYPFKQYLSSLGITFPLFTQALPRDPKGFIRWNEPEVTRSVEMPDPVRKMILEGMSLVTRGARGTARPAAMRAQYQTSEAMNSYRKIGPSIYSKTGTAEILYKQTIDAESPANLEKHVSYGAISFNDKTCEDPELVVVVYLRFGTAGNQGTPMATRLIEKWREIQARNK
jgi:cell division protein FtsI/penicillin-binding protein 2